MIVSCYVAENQTQVLLVIKQPRKERFTTADSSIAQSIFKGDQDRSSRVEPEGRNHGECCFLACLAFTFSYYQDLGLRSSTTHKVLGVPTAISLKKIP